ncbi:MAG: OmpA family protein [Thermotogae bacterium]|nr:OmpA family protein [Thermotogota bacterium]
MRAVLGLAVIALGGGILYLYYGKVVPLQKVVADLYEENTRLIKQLPTGRVERTEIKEDRTIVRIPSDSLFMPGSTELSPQGKRKLNTLASDLKRSGFNLLEVAVYTDRSPVKSNRDRYPTNWELAAGRATTIVRYLISRGLPPQKLAAISYGDSRASGTSASDRMVEFRIF